MTIGYYAFADSPALENVVIGESVETWYTDWGTNGAFMNCPRLTTLEIKDGCLWIGEYAFQNCPSLESVDVPITVTGVGEHAFENCTGMTHLSMQRGTIGNAAFQGCNALNDVQLTRITSIGEYAFQNCISLNEFTIPDTVTSIGHRALANTSIAQIVVPESVTYLGYGVFADCPGLLTAVIGNNITEWGTDWGDNDMFANDAALQYVIVEDGANSLPSRMFINCSALIGVQLPETVVSYTNDMFEDASESAAVYGSGSKMAALASENGVAYVEGAIELPEYEMATITVTASEGGRVALPTELTKPVGSMAAVWCVPAPGYMLNSIFVNGIALNNADRFAVTGDSAIEVSFVEDPSYVDPYASLDGDAEAPEGEEPSETEEASGETEEASETEESSAEETPAEEGAMAGAGPFTEADDVYASAMTYLNGVLSFASDQYLEADNTITAGALLNLLYRLEKTPEVEWVDYDPSVTADSWYGKACVWSVEAGILEAGNLEGFDPNVEVGRMTAALILHRYAEYKGVEVASDASLLEGYEDALEFVPAGILTGAEPDTSGFFGALGWGMANGLTYGTDGTMIEAYEPALCGQCTRMIASFLADQIGQ